VQRKAYVPGVTVLLLALLSACTGSGDDGGENDAKPDSTATSASAAPPGKYRTLPEPCGAVTHGTLDSLLPGIRQITDADQRANAYEGVATTTFDTDRRVGCRWKMESSAATDHLLVDFERVVSYDGAVSDDSRAEQLYLVKEVAADLPEPSAPATTPTPTTTGTGTGTPSPEQPVAATGGAASPGKDASAGEETDAPSGPPTGSSSPSGPAATPTALQPRVLDDLGDEAFLNDQLSTTSTQRTVTVVFRTSNVLVTVQYEEQSATVTQVPDSKEMQDRARKLAAQLAGQLAG